MNTSIELTQEDDAELERVAQKMIELERSGDSTEGKEKAREAVRLLVKFCCRVVIRSALRKAIDGAIAEATRKGGKLSFSRQ